MPLEAPAPPLKREVKTGVTVEAKRGFISQDVLQLCIRDTYSDELILPGEEICGKVKLFAASGLLLSSLTLTMSCTYYKEECIVSQSGNTTTTHSKNIDPIVLRTVEIELQNKSIQMQKGEERAWDFNMAALRGMPASFHVTDEEHKWYGVKEPGRFHAWASVKHTLTAVARFAVGTPSCTASVLLNVGCGDEKPDDLPPPGEAELLDRPLAVAGCCTTFGVCYHSLALAVRDTAVLIPSVRAPDARAIKALVGASVTVLDMPDLRVNVDIVQTREYGLRTITRRFPIYSEDGPLLPDTYGTLPKDAPKHVRITAVAPSPQPCAMRLVSGVLNADFAPSFVRSSLAITYSIVATFGNLELKAPIWLTNNPCAIPSPV